MWKYSLNTFKDAYSFNKNSEFRDYFPRPQIKETNKKPIVLLGCSFTQGTGLGENETLYYKLSNYTNRSVYTYAIGGAGPSQALYEIENGFPNVNNPEYIIYNFIEYHITRMYIPTSFFFPLICFYKVDKKGFLIPKNEFDILWYHSYTARALYEKYINYSLSTPEFNKLATDFLLKHFVQMKKVASKKYPESKFVIFAYDGEKGLNNKSYIKSIENNLKKEGFIVVYMDELSDIDFTQKPYVLDDGHPSSYAWNIVVPKLAQRLHL